MFREERSVIRRRGQSSLLQAVDCIGKSHVPEFVMMAVRFPIGRDVYDLRPLFPV